MVLKSFRFWKDFRHLRGRPWMIDDLRLAEEIKKNLGPSPSKTNLFKGSLNKCSWIYSQSFTTAFFYCHRNGLTKLHFSWAFQRYMTCPYTFSHPLWRQPKHKSHQCGHTCTNISKIAMSAVLPWRDAAPFEAWRPGEISGFSDVTCCYPRLSMWRPRGWANLCTLCMAVTTFWRHL